MSTTPFQTTVLLRSEETGGEVSVIENTLPAGFAGPPLHHHDFDEAFYVLDGELTFQVRDALLTAGPGDFAFAPRGVPHTLANHGDAPARYLLVCTPAGFERYFARIAAAAAGADPPDWARQPTPEVTTVGPQIPPGGVASRPDASDPRVRTRVLLRGEDSGAYVSMMDNSVPADAQGPFLHTHDFDEAFYIVDGELTFRVEDELVTAGAGDLAFAPRGVPHAFTNRSGAPARTLIVCTPAGFERYFARIAAGQAGAEPPAWAREPIPEVTRVGPRIGED